jgi:hypothetical protein
MKFHVGANRIDEPKGCTGLVRRLPPTLTDMPVGSAIEHHGMAHAQLLAKKGSLKIVSEITNPLESDFLGWVKRHASGKEDIHKGSSG